MNDMENKELFGSEENNTQGETAQAADQPPVSPENAVPRSSQYQYQPPASRPAPPAYGAAPTQTPYGGYSFGQQPADGGAQTPPPSTPPGNQWNFPEYGAPSPKKPTEKKKGSGLKIFAGILGALLGVAVLSFAVFGIYSLMMPQQNIIDAPQSQPSGETSANENVPELETNSKPSDNTVSTDGTLTTAQINEKVAPSVVGIVQYQANYFEPTGEGSGIILSEDGYIATNAHVIENADSLEVVLSDGTTYKGTVVGYDSKTDLAVVKIDANGLTPAELGASGELKVGEKAIAIGNPGGLTYAGSVSEGIVSGLNRSLRAATDGYTMNFIQTDAAISPGNSGGALVNEFGQVIGINSQKLAADGYEGIGFAIPIDEALPILKDLMSYGRVTGRVKLGITAYAVNEYVASVNGIPSGILIDTIDADSTLLATDVQAGDIITQVEGTAVSSFTSLSDLLRDYSPGDQVTLTIFRASQSTGNSRYGYAYGGQTVQGSTFEVKVTLMEDTGATTSSNLQSNSTQGNVQNDQAA
ncbi:MAG: trypsin-like peptidase domain-containing protein [Oscillospiraceae bacterium]|nr:trypsin-like peptidase domain-containing protein [Oscillospiraceae bacterium]